MRIMINVFLHRIIVGFFPAFMLTLKPMSKYKLRFNSRFCIFLLICVISASSLIILCNGKITVTFTISNVITWGIIPFTNWLVMGLCYLYFYTKQFLLFDSLFLTSASLRVLGETHEIPIALIKGYFLNSFVTGLIYLPFLLLYVQHNKWKRTMFFIPLLALMLTVLLISPYVYSTQYMTVFSYLSRFVVGLFYFEFARGFIHG